MKIDSIRGVALVLAAAVLWGTTGTARSFAPLSLSAYWVGALRLAVAGLFFLVCLRVLRWRANRPAHAGRAPGPALADAGAVLAAGASMAVYNLAFFAGVQATGVAVGTAVAIGSGPVWAGVLQGLASRRLPGTTWWLGTALAIAGGMSMVMGQAEGAPVSGTGIGLCLLSGASYAVYALISKHLVGRAHPVQVTARVFVTAAVLALAGAWLLAGRPGAPTVATAGTVLYLGVMATGVAYLLFGSGLRHISGATGVTLALGEPVTAFMLAILVVGERPSPSAYVGLVLVLCGLAIVVRAELASR